MRENLAWIETMQKLNITSMQNIPVNTDSFQYRYNTESNFPCIEKDKFKLWENASLNFKLIPT